MNRIIIPVIAFLTALSLIYTVNAQDGNNAPISLDGATGSITVQQSIPVSTTVEIEVNGQIYNVTIPAMLEVDAASVLMAGADSVNTVGDMAWDIIEIKESTEEVTVGSYSTIEPTEGNKAVVMEVRVTNLGKETTDPRYSGSFGGYDSVGNVYDVDESSCDDIDPGETSTCIVGFDVPEDVNMVGLEIEAVQKKRLAYTPSE